MIVSDAPTSYGTLLNMPGVADIGGVYARLPLCIDPGAHYFQVDHIKADTAVCTRCGLIRKTVVK